MMKEWLVALELPWIEKLRGISSAHYYTADDDDDDQPFIIAVSVVVALLYTLLVLIFQFWTPANPVGRCVRFYKQLRVHEKSLSTSHTVDSGITEYSKLHRENDTETKLSKYKDLVNAYYDLATVFYEWGWGSSFHFSFQYPSESFGESIRRHEYQLASQLNVVTTSSSSSGGASSPTNNKMAHILDVGCGIAGPARNISRFLQGTKVTGITLNPYQVQRGNELNMADRMYSNVTSVQGDFMELPFDDNTFDGVYAIEATCHAPDRVQCYAEILRVLKPGATFACYEWCMTDQYDPTNAQHQILKANIEEGNGLPDIIDTKQCWTALRDAGFELVSESDLGTVQNVQPWMTPLQPSWNPLSQRFQFNPVGAVITNGVIAALETLRIAPAGTVKTQKILQAGGFALRDAGEIGIFTTMYLMVGRKPLLK